MTHRQHVLHMQTQHAGLAVQALDLYSRIGIGQLEMLMESPSVRTGLTDAQRAEAEWLINRLKLVLFGLPEHASYSIVNERTAPAAKRAWDLRNVIRHRLAMDRAGNPTERDFRTMLTVDFDTPEQLSDLPLATISSTDA